mgnify:CR=1 FL=1|tara:strand:+ start:434 stop:739 length:306 start_codon:yes stop_codon:yes gene_type:complete
MPGSNTSNKVTIAGGVLAILIALGGIVYAAEDRFNQSQLEQEIQKLEKATVKSLEDFRKQQLLKEYRDLTLREKFGELSPFERARKDEIEIELKVLIPVNS